MPPSDSNVVRLLEAREARDLEAWRKRKRAADRRAHRVRSATWLADQIAEAGGTEQQIKETLTKIYGEDVANEVTHAE